MKIQKSSYWLVFSRLVKLYELINRKKTEIKENVGQEILNSQNVSELPIDINTKVVEEEKSNDSDQTEFENDSVINEINQDINLEPITETELSDIKENEVLSESKQKEDLDIDKIELESNSSSIDTIKSINETTESSVSTSGETKKLEETHTDSKDSVEEIFEEYEKELILSAVSDSGFKINEIEDLEDNELFEFIKLSNYLLIDDLSKILRKEFLIRLSNTIN